MLNAALLKETASRAALRSPSYFSSVHQHISSDGTGKTRFRNAWRLLGSELRVFAARRQRLGDCAMNFFVDRHRGRYEDRIVRGDNNRVSKIIAMKNNPAASPTTDDIMLTGVIGHVHKFTEITERKRRL